MKLLNDIEENYGQKTLVNTTIYLLGELYNEIDKDIFNDNHLIELFKKCKLNYKENNYLINTYFKLLTNEKYEISNELNEFCKNEIESMKKNYNFELQERACEYSIFFKKSSIKIDMNIPSYNDKKDKKNFNENKVIFDPNLNPFPFISV